MPGSPPTIQLPAIEEVVEKAEAHYIDLSEEEAEVMRETIRSKLAVFESLDLLPDPTPETTYADRSSGYRPQQEADPHNAFVTKCRVPGDDDGLLSGYDVGVKDNVAVAGVEMTCGSKVMNGYYPARDATVVERLLDEGATVTGKTNMGDMAISGSYSATGPVINPHSDSHLAGGSSGGSAVSVVTEDVDVAIGTDQGGSIRIPASWSGCVGLKPTFGLVPYTGIVGLGHTFDHAGPMARSVADCARTLDAVAGVDELDPRQHRERADDYEAALTGEVDDVTVGVLEEGFGFDESEAAVDRTVRDALERFEGETDATVESVSVPLHLDGVPIWNGVFIEAVAALVRSEGMGRFVGGHYDAQFGGFFGKARRVHADDFPPTLKLVLILGEYLSEEYLGHYYAKAQNLRRELARAYDDALRDVDVLAMPTTPQKAPEAREDVTSTDILESLRISEKIRNANTAPFNVTGHPAVSVPCGTADDLPVGLMLVGNRHADGTLLRVADAFEREVESP